jgi:hypothetical protein
LLAAFIGNPVAVPPRLLQCQGIPAFPSANPASIAATIRSVTR